MKMEHFEPRRTLCTFATLVCWVFSALAVQSAAAETRFASPDGKSGNRGTSRSTAWDAASCFDRLAPGDTCIYLDGNYGAQNFAPTDNGTAAQRITHECESVHGCLFNRIVMDGVAHVTVKNIASDTNFYDSTKSFTNPRMAVYRSHDLTFDSIYVRGEPQACADGNTGSGCKSPSDYNRYNDLIRIGNPNQAADTSWKIEITGQTEFIDGNHSVIQMYDDQDSQYCEERESDIWIHGTPDVPIRMSSKYHHIISFKGACRVLIEHVDFGPAGTGRGDRVQPANAIADQAGGVLHTSKAEEIIVRYSNFRRGGSSTSVTRNNSHIEVGMFGDRVGGACFPHNSHHQPWGTFATIGRLNDVEFLTDVSILNNAVSSPWYMNERNPSAATSPYNGFAIARTGQDNFVQVDIDGIVVSGGSGTELYTGLKGRKRGFSDSVSYIDGIQFGDTLVRAGGPIFQRPQGWNFSPVAGSPLVGTAVPIASATSAGSGRNIPVDRPECFAGTMNGLREGDMIDVGGAHCTVRDVDISSGTLTCRESISWSRNAPIRYKLDGSVVRDIGSQVATGAGSAPPTVSDDNAPPKPPALTIEK